MGDFKESCPPPTPKPCPPKACVEKDTERINVTVDDSGETELQGPTILEQKEESQSQGKCLTIWHPGFDARFPNQNQTRCQEKFGEDYEGCEYFKKTYELLCPGFWIEHWNEQRENGTFPYPRR